MSEKVRLDLTLSTKDANGKARYTRVGSVWLSTDKDGNPTASIAIDAGVSIGTPQGTYLNGYFPRDRDEQRPAQRAKPDADDLPF